MKIFGIILILFSLVDSILVFARYMFKFYIFGYQELINFLTCPIMLLGLYCCSIANKHIAIDLLPILKNDSYSKFIKKINTMLTFLMFCMLLAGAINSFCMNVKSDSVSLAYSTPMYYYDVIVGLFLLIFIVDATKNSFNNKKS